MSILDRSKKKKANTPLRSNYTEHDDKRQYKSKKSLSEMLNKMKIDVDKDDDNNNVNDDESTSDLKSSQMLLRN